MSQGKVKSLAMLFNSYPALTWSVEATKAKVEVFLSALEPYSDAQVETACQVVMRRNSPFPPSAGELAHECGAAVVYVPDQAKLAKFRAQGEPASTMSEEERAAGRARVAKMLADFKAGLPLADKAISAREVVTRWKPGPLGSLIADDLMKLMPKEALPSAVDQAVEIDDDAPLF